MDPLNPARDTIGADLGFMGTAKHEVTAQWDVLRPHKTPPKGELTDDQVDFNDRFNHVRARVEQVFGALKNKFGVLHTFRGHERRLDEVFLICCALYNLEKRREDQQHQAERPVHLRDILNT